MFKKSFLLIVAVILLILPIVTADTKPIAAEVESNIDLNGAVVNLFVEIDDGDLGKITCRTKDLIEFGESAFSTNLGNLVYNDFLDVSCNDLWFTGDIIWYEIKQNDNIWISEEEKIKAGTGLQMLSKLEIKIADVIVPKNNEKNSGGSSGGSSDGSNGDSSGESVDMGKKNKKMNNIRITNLKIINDYLKITNELNLEFGSLNYFELKHVIYSYPFEDIVQIFVDKDISNLRGQEIIEEFSIVGMNPGRYKLRSFIYSSGKVVGVSEVFVFNIDGEKLLPIKKQAEEQIPKPVSLEEKVLEKIPIWMLISITFALMALFLFLGKLIKDN